jgi:hypothetical protein
MQVKKTAALREMFLRRMIGTPSQPGAFKLFSIWIKFLIPPLGDVYEDGSSLNALLLKTEQLSWTEVDKQCHRVLSWSRENLGAIALAFSDFVMTVSPSSFKAGIPRYLSLIILVKPQKDLWLGLKARMMPKEICHISRTILLRSSVLSCLCQARLLV